VLIPAYNEALNIENVVSAVRIALPEAEILVVNDGSSDDTAEILRRMKNVIALHLPFNMGIGGAVQTGFRYFLDHDHDFLIRLDGDGQHPPSEAEKLLPPLQNGEADLVIGSRFITKQGYQSSAYRRGGIKLLSILTNFIIKQNITDNTSGFRAFNRRAAAALAADYPFDYPEPVEVYMLARKGYRIREIPITMTARTRGSSSISLRHSYYYLVKVLVTIGVNFIGGGKK